MRNRNWIITVPLAIVGVAFLYFVFLPISKRIDALRVELASKEAFIAQDAQLSASLAATQRKLAETHAFIDKWLKESPQPGQLSPLFGEINRRARVAGTTLVNFDPQPAVEMDSLRRIPLRLGVHGSYAQIQRLMTSLEEVPATLWVESLRIESSQGPDKPLHAEISLALFTANPDNSD